MGQKLLRTFLLMTQHDKIGVAVLIALFVALIAALVWAFKGGAARSHAPGDSPIIRQRIINLQKGK